MKCFEIDFNSWEPFTAVDITHTPNEEWQYLSMKELPVKGEEVFVFSLEQTGSRPINDVVFEPDIGFGFVTQVTDVYPSPVTPNCYIIEFKPTWRDNVG